MSKFKWSKSRNYVAKYGHHFNKGGPHPNDRRLKMYEEIEQADYDEMEDTLVCPACHSEHPWTETYQGHLASVEHHRCRSCGFQFSHWEETE